MAQAALHDVSFSLNEGEILGIYGLLGSGRTELLEAIAGLRRMALGEVRLRDSVLRNDSVRSALKAGIVLMPEDRQRDGLFPDLSIRENMAMAATPGYFLSRREEVKRVNEIAGDLHITVSRHRTSRHHVFPAGISKKFCLRDACCARRLCC